jgi:glycerophosphoryl diester phosphodiesterase
MTTHAAGPRPVTDRPLPLVIAHRGASGHLPEHTLAAKALAVGLGAHAIEQDVVLSRDGVPIVFHDPYLEATTDVASRYPSRARADGHYWVMDFVLAELRTLQLRERVDPKTGEPRFAGRYAGTAGSFGIVTLDEELAFARSLERTLGRTVAVYPEIKHPAEHRAAGLDASRAVLAALERHGYRTRRDAAYLQCFDAAELKRVRTELRSELTLIQLIGDPRDEGPAGASFARMLTREGLAEVATYADGIGPWLAQIVQWPEAGRPPVFTTLVADAHAAGLVVHPYTLRRDALPANAPDLEALHEALFVNAGIDGAFSDFPELTLEFLRRQGQLAR